MPMIYYGVTSVETSNIVVIVILNGKKKRRVLVNQIKLSAMGCLCVRFDRLKNKVESKLCNKTYWN